MGRAKNPAQPVERQELGDPLDSWYLGSYIVS